MDVASDQHDLLIAAPERWDEACFAIPAIRALIAPGLDVGVICKKSQLPLWETVDDLEIVCADYSPKTIVKAIDSNWAAALLFETGPLAKATKSAKIPRRIGMHEKKLAKLLTHPLKITPGPLDHRVRHYLSIAETMGVDVLDPAFFAPSSNQTQAQPNSILLCPDSDFGSHHEWSLDRWESLAKKLIADDKEIHIASISEQRELGSSLAKLLGKPNTAITIDSLADFLDEFAKHSLVIACDGSLPHLAAHAGATCVTLFGPNDPRWKRPLGTRHGIARHHVECAPCLLEKCPIDLRCQHEMNVETVLKVIAECAEHST